MDSKGESSSWLKVWAPVKAILSNGIVREDLQPGDHIYTWRAGYIYAHHGIYIGEEMVIHFVNAGQGIASGSSSNKISPSFFTCDLNTDPCEICKDRVANSGVIKSCLNCFLSKGDLYRFEYSAPRLRFHVKLRGLCTMVPSDPPSNVIRRAKRLLEIGFGTYNLFTKNCEDFAIYCKTSLLAELGNSSQVQSMKAAMFSITKPLFIGGLTMSACVQALENYCENRCKNDVGSRAKKVSLEDLESMLN